MKNFSNELKYQRLKRNLTIMQIEKDTGIKNSNLSRWENDITTPSIEFCVILADYYGISIDELIGHDINN